VFEGTSVRRFGNGVSTYLSPKDTVFSPINWLGIARISGSDAANFLQAQLTGDISDVGPEITRISGYCNPKGRLLAIFRVLREGDDFLLLSDSDILPNILQRLRMYVLRMKVDLAVETTRVAIGLVGPDADRIVAELSGSPSEIANDVVCKQGICSIPFGEKEKGYLIIAPKGIEHIPCLQTTSLAISDGLPESSATMRSASGPTRPIATRVVSTARSTFIRSTYIRNRWRILGRMSESDKSRKSSPSRRTRKMASNRPFGLQ
jgi:hypothetical protein